MRASMDLYRFSKGMKEDKSEGSSKEINLIAKRKLVI